MPFEVGKYNYKFTKENYDRISVLLPKGTKQEIIDKTGESINAFVNRVVRECLDKIDSAGEMRDQDAVLSPSESNENA